MSVISCLRSDDWGRDMKKFCRYAVVEVETACLLVCGQKWKNFANTAMGNLPVRYVKTGTFRRFSIRWHKVTEYIREIDIKGRRCVIIYWADERAKKGKLYNIVQWCGVNFRLRGREYCFNEKIDYRATYRRLLDSLGVF